MITQMFYLYVYQQQTYLIKSNYLFDITVLTVFIVETESNGDICQRIESRARIEVANKKCRNLLFRNMGLRLIKNSPMIIIDISVTSTTNVTWLEIDSFR